VQACICTAAQACIRTAVQANSGHSAGPAWQQVCWSSLQASCRRYACSGPVFCLISGLTVVAVVVSVGMSWQARRNAPGTQEQQNATTAATASRQSVGHSPPFHPFAPAPMPGGAQVGMLCSGVVMGLQSEARSLNFDSRRRAVSEPRIQALAPQRDWPQMECVAKYLRRAMEPPVVCHPALDPREAAQLSRSCARNVLRTIYPAWRPRGHPHIPRVCIARVRQLRWMLDCSRGYTVWKKPRRRIWSAGIRDAQGAQRRGFQASELRTPHAFA
jgi:hypothetical protein